MVVIRWDGIMTDNNMWIYCPVCQSKTRIKIRKETELKFFPLFCPKCKEETVIHVKNESIYIVHDNVS